MMQYNFFLNTWISIRLLKWGQQIIFESLTIFIHHGSKSKRLHITNNLNLNISDDITPLCKKLDSAKKKEITFNKISYING